MKCKVADVYLSAGAMYSKVYLAAGAVYSKVYLAAEAVYSKVHLSAGAVYSKVYLAAGAGEVPSKLETEALAQIVNTQRPFQYFQHCK